MMLRFEGTKDLAMIKIIKRQTFITKLVIWALAGILMWKGAEYLGESDTDQSLSIFIFYLYAALYLVMGLEVLDSFIKICFKK